MMRAAIALSALLALAGCAGTASYSVRTFYEPTTQQMVCCEASIRSSRDIQSVTVDVAKQGADYQIHFAETGVSASAPISAGTASISAVAGAVTAAANAAAQFSLKP